MFKSFGILAVLAAMFTVGPVAVATSGVAEAKACKARYIRAWGGRKLTMFGARVSARYAWKRAARRHYGPAYDTWWASKRKSMRCYTNRRGQKRCRAGAFACTVL